MANAEAETASMESALLSDFKTLFRADTLASAE
jgi:hypothetical protein